MLRDRPWILLAVAGYVVILWIVHRFRRRGARRRGLTPERLSAFDHRGFLDDLKEIYEAALGPDGEEREGAPVPEGTGKLPPKLAERLGAPPAWLRPDVWERGSLAWAAEPVRRARDRAAAGRDAEVDGCVEAGQDPEVDQQLAALGIHFFVVRLYGGDLDGAARVLRRLPTWTRDRISVRVVDKHLAGLAALRAEAEERAGPHVREARRAIARAGGGGRYADGGTRALWAHLSLRHGRSLLFEEIVLFQVDRAIRKGLSENRSSPLLYYELAHCCLWRGRTEEAVEHLARALYFAGRDPFYARPILDSPEVARLKPALVRQARTRLASEGTAGRVPTN